MKRIITMLVFLVVLLNACAEPEPTATPEPATAVPPTTEPTEEPTAEPTADTSEVEAETDMLNLGALTEHPWQWVSFTNPAEQFDVETPEAYLLQFNSDDTVNIVADCNNANGSYTADGSSLTVDIGPMTRAACPPESRSDQFVTYLGSTASYFFEDGNLYIDLMADGGTMVFAPASSDAMADDGEGAMDGALLANDWQWVSFTNPMEQFDVEMPQNYQLRFLDDGTISVTADCNNAFIPYTDEAGSLSVEAGPTTLALCPGDSRSEQFVRLLGGAARYFFEDGNLFIDLMADGGTMEFAPVSMLELTSTPWQWLRFTGNSGVYDIEMPEGYLLTFNDDGTLNIVADCNSSAGDYTDADGDLDINIGPTTLALCTGDSRSEAFIQLLDGSIRYFIDGNNLFVVVEEDGGTLGFAPASSDAMGDDGSFAIVGDVGTLPEELTAQLDALLQSQVFAEGDNPEFGAPGLVLYVETPNGRYLNAAGVANLDDELAMQGDDILEIGSNTKSMTIVLLMQLVEEGLISLDDPLSQWLPEQAAALPNGDQITIRQMAQHTAGLYDYADNIIAAGIEDSASMEASFTPEELVQDAIDNGTPYFTPGEEGQWYYSNTGYVLLGMIIEDITGESLSDLFQTRIFDPLGMETAVFLESVPEERQITTHGYWWTEEGDILDTTNWNASQGWAAGAAAMTAEDLATYGKALAAGDLFQNPDTLQEMLNWNEDAQFSVGGPYGLGLIDFAGDGSVWGHGGQTLGFQSIWFVDPAQEIVVVGLTNSATYSANNLLQARYIVNGDTAQPLSYLTILPVGSFVTTKWGWTQFVTPAEMMDVDETAGLRIQLGQDKSVIVTSNDCGLAFGTYTTPGLKQIDFEIDASSLICDAESLAAQLVQHLNDATNWHQDNDQLVVELPADAGTLVFDYIPPE